MAGLAAGRAFIGRICRMAAAVTGDRAGHAVELVERRLHAPKTATRKQRALTRRQQRHRQNLEAEGDERFFACLFQHFHIFMAGR